MSSDMLISQATIRNVRHSPSISADDIVISVRNVGKMYYLYDHPQDRLKQAFLWGRKKLYREFWALRDVSFEVKRGETVGIIGRNGAGKSTLLQIIAGTLAPTTGEVLVNGRVAALLELGSGFNPEFTGRENVYLNGAIWGFSREEIDERFDEIAAFADIGQFIEQPVKLYSSGMFVRLAFAVQAFVSKEVLVVDEVLAVGDEAFQRKCMAVLEKFRDNGGTVLLVSHSTQTIVRQCERCLLLSQGELLVDGLSKPVTDLYQRLMFSDPQDIASILTDLRQHGLEYALSQSQVEEKVKERRSAEVSKITDRGGQIEDRDSKQIIDEGPPDWFNPNMPKPSEVSYGHGGAEIIDYGVYNEQGQKVNVLVVGRRYKWVYLVKFYQDAHDVQFGMLLKTVDGIDVAAIASKRELVHIDYIPASSVVEASFSIKLNIAPGTYFLNAGVDSGETDEGLAYLHRRVDICMIRVLPCDSREVHGIAYLEPEFSYSFKPNSPQILNETR